MRTLPFSKFTPALLASLLAAGGLPAADSDEIAQLRAQLQALEQKILVLERKQEIKDEESAIAARTAPKITVNDKGFTLASGDGANSLRLRGLVQLDSRLFLGDSGLVNNSFVLRRARLFFEGTLGRDVSFQLVPEFAGGTGSAATTPSILDANFGFSVSPQLQFKFGKFKAPVGLEMLQSEQATFFDERSLATNLVPNRDIGVQAGGEVLNGTVAYSAAILNGVPDAGSSTNADFDNDKDAVVRVMATPFRHDDDSSLHGLSFGVSGSFGREKSVGGRTAGYKTDGQQTFFSYNTATAADGQTWRISPQFDYRSGSFGAMGEFVLSTVNLRPGATGPKTEAENHAWQIAADYVLTGEDSSYSGVTPRANFNLANGTWGAFEVTARVASLKVDDDVFPLYASVATNADEARSFGVGLNWYLAKSVILKFDYLQTTFGLPPGAPAVSGNSVLRQDEKVFITRFQLSF